MCRRKSLSHADLKLAKILFLLILMGQRMIYKNVFIVSIQKHAWFVHGTYLQIFLNQDFCRSVSALQLPETPHLIFLIADKIQQLCTVTLSDAHLTNVQKEFVIFWLQIFFLGISLKTEVCLHACCSNVAHTRLHS